MLLIIFTMAYKKTCSLYYFVILLTLCQCMINTMIGASVKTLWDLHYYRENGMVTLLHKNNNKHSIDVVIWKGYGYRQDDYTQFGTSIQNYGNLRDLNINVFIPSYNIIPRCCKKNMTILFGHSDGGFKCLENKNEKIIGKITYGATHNSKGNLYNGMFKIKKTDIPSLSMIGQYDGFISFGCLIDEIDDNLNIHNVVCVRGTNHLCIVKNKELQLSKSIFGLSDYVVKTDYRVMMNRVASITIDYINHLIGGNNTMFEKYIDESEQLLKKTTLYNITNFVDFLRCKPSSQCVAYVHQNSNYIYIKSYDKIIRDDIVNTTRCFTTLEWVMRNMNNTISYFQYKSFMYLKIPLHIFNHVEDSSFWFDMYLVNR